MSSNNRFERSRGTSPFGPRRELDDLDKSASFRDNATPRRSTSSLDSYARQLSIERGIDRGARVVGKRRR